jgi:hypothetical protein
LKQEVTTMLLGQVMTSEQLVWADAFVAGKNTAAKRQQKNPASRTFAVCTVELFEARITQCAHYYRFLPSIAGKMVRIKTAG